MEKISRLEDELKSEADHMHYDFKRKIFVWLGRYAEGINVLWQSIENKLDCGFDSSKREIKVIKQDIETIKDGLNIIAVNLGQEPVFCKTRFGLILKNRYIQDALDLKPKTIKALNEQGIQYLDQLLSMSELELLKIKGIGDIKFSDIVSAINIARFDNFKSIVKNNV